MATTGTNPSDPQSSATQTYGTTQTQSAGDAARQESQGLADRAREKAGEFKEQAEGAVRERARSIVDSQKEAAISRIEGVADALRSASENLRERGQPMVADYSRQLAEGLERMAHSMSQRNLDDIVRGVQDFARQRPVAFLGGAMVAGFALARFMKSSSSRRARWSEGDYGETWRGGAGMRGDEHRQYPAGSAGMGRTERGQHPATSTGMGGREYGQHSGSAGTRGTGAADWPGGPSQPEPASTGASGVGGHDRPREGGF